VSLTLIQGANAVRQSGRLGQTQTLLQGDELQQKVRDYITQAQSLLEQESLKELAKIFAEEGLNDTAPADAY